MSKTLRAVSAILLCICISLQTTSNAKANHLTMENIESIQNIDDIRDLGTGTYKLEENDGNSNKVTIFQVGEIETNQSKNAVARTMSTSTYHRTLAQTCEYYNASGTQIYSITCTATFYWNSTYVWCTYGYYNYTHNSAYTMSITKNSYSSAKTSALYTYYIVNATFKGNGNTYKVVSQIGCSKYGDPSYYKEM